MYFLSLSVVPYPLSTARVRALSSSQWEYALVSPLSKICLGTLSGGLFVAFFVLAKSGSVFEFSASRVGRGLVM